MKTESDLILITVRSILAILIVLVLVTGKSLLIPFAWSMLIALAGMNLIDRVEKKTLLSRGLVICLFLLLILAVIFLVGYFFYIELHRIFDDLPTISREISAHLHNLSLSLRKTGIHIPDHIDHNFISEWIHRHNDLFMNFISELGMDIWNVILIMLYLFFILYYRDLVPLFFTRKISDKRKLVSLKEQFQKSMTLIRSYINGLLVLTVISAVMNFLVFLVFGLEFAIFFAIFLAILNLIPFIGNPIGLAVIMLFALITKDNVWIPALMFAALFVMNFLQDNVIRPLIIGDKMKINAFAVFVAIIIGGMIWGVSGMILFIPVAGIIKIILEGHKTHEPYAVFLSSPEKKSGAIQSFGNNVVNGQ